MANGVTDLLDSLYRMIDDARGGLGGTCRINRDDALDLLDEIRNKFPAELSEAKKLLTQRNEYLVYLRQCQRQPYALRRRALFQHRALRRLATPAGAYESSPIKSDIRRPFSGRTISQIMRFT